MKRKVNSDTNKAAAVTKITNAAAKLTGCAKGGN
jgi:hypothetical protein